MKDFSDYHQYSWSKVAPPTPYVITFLPRLPFYTLILILSYVIFIPNIMNQVDRSGQTFYAAFIALLSIAVTLGLNFVLDSIAKARGPKLINYQISKEGIYINRRKYPYANLKTTSAQEIVSALKLSFPDEKSQQQALTSLTHYVSRQ